MRRHFSYDYLVLRFLFLLFRGDYRLLLWPNCKCFSVITHGLFPLVQQQYRVMVNVITLSNICCRCFQERCKDKIENAKQTVTERYNNSNYVLYRNFPFYCEYRSKICSPKFDLVNNLSGENLRKSFARVVMHFWLSSFPAFSFITFFLVWDTYDTTSKQ